MGKNNITLTIQKVDFPDWKGYGHAYSDYLDTKIESVYYICFDIVRELEDE